MVCGLAWSLVESLAIVFGNQRLMIFSSLFDTLQAWSDELQFRQDRKKGSLSVLPSVLHLGPLRKMLCLC